MYESYFGLRTRPFSAIPDPSCWFAPPAVQNVLDELTLRAAAGEGIGVLAAAAGLGKSLLCRRLIAELAGQFTPVYLANANFATRRALLQAIRFELGRSFTGMDEQELRLELIATLKELADAGRALVLVVDEAHLISDRLLEELRALAGQVARSQPLVRLILAGQLSLEEKLADPIQAALNERVVAHAYLEPFTQQESRDYIEHRVRWAGGDAERLFEPEALDSIARLAGGVPRCLNQLSDHSLLLACVHEAPRVTLAIVDEALADLKHLPLNWNEALKTSTDSADDDFVEEEHLGAPGDMPIGEYDTFESYPRDSDCTVFEIGDAAGLAVGMAAPESRVGQPSLSEILDAVGVGTPPAETGASRLISLEAVPMTSPRIFTEERIADRFADVTLSTTFRMRTFEETALDYGPQTAERAFADFPAAPPAPPTDAPVEALRDTAQARPLPNQPAGAATGSELRQAPAADSMIPDRADVEDEIGNSVLDVCLEVQHSLGSWWEGADNSGTLAPGALAESESSSHAIASAPRGRQYDVVEPPLISEPASVADRARHVPPPNYKHVFSTLRRKLGRNLRCR
ncbi:MAG: ExeA family protein [Planctomycetaceae bacterium]